MNIDIYKQAIIDFETIQTDAKSYYDQIIEDAEQAMNNQIKEAMSPNSLAAVVPDNFKNKAQMDTLIEMQKALEALAKQVKG